LLRQAGINYIPIPNEFDEVYPPTLDVHEIPKFLAEAKAEFHKEMLEGDDVLLTADTLVILGDKVMGKPKSTPEAKELLYNLSGKSHEVITGVCLLSRSLKVSFDETTEVTFRKLTEEEITHYVKKYLPYDKAGAYGIQEWLGLIGIEKIVGSYPNVVGLPVHRVWYELQQFH
jgi:septum formation protein